MNLRERLSTVLLDLDLMERNFHAQLRAVREDIGWIADKIQGQQLIPEVKTAKPETSAGAMPPTEFPADACPRCRDGLCLDHGVFPAGSVECGTEAEVEKAIASGKPAVIAVIPKGQAHPQ